MQYGSGGGFERSSSFRYRPASSPTANPQPSRAVIEPIVARPRLSASHSSAIPVACAASWARTKRPRANASVPIRSWAMPSQRQVRIVIVVPPHVQ